MLCCNAVIIMKNIKLILITFIVGNLSGLFGYSILFLQPTDKTPPLYMHTQLATLPSESAIIQPTVKNTSASVTKECVAEANSEDPELIQAQSHENRHMLKYLIEQKIINKTDSLDSVRQQLLNNYQDIVHPFNERLDNISMYSQLNKSHIPQHTVELLLTDLLNLDENHQSDQIIQVVNLLQNNLAEHQLSELSHYLNSDDPYIQASVLQTIGQTDPHNEYQEQIFQLWQNSPFHHVREQAYFVLKKRYQYNFLDE